MNKRNSKISVLRVPSEIGDLICQGSFPLQVANPLVVFSFVSGEESLFDTRKGLFMSPPEGVHLPSRETLKSFGRVIESYRRNFSNKSGVKPTTFPSARLSQGIKRIERFEVCS